MTDTPMWPCPEVVSAPPILLDKTLVCEHAFQAQIGNRLGHPCQPDSNYCYEHMPKPELISRVREHLKYNLKWVARLSEVRATTQAEIKRASPGANSGGVASLNQERRNGAKVRYPMGGERFSEPVPTIWTPKSCYPYPNHRRRLGLAGSYATSECQVLATGWLPGQKPQK